jgi:hypothetical protein
MNIKGISVFEILYCETSKILLVLFPEVVILYFICFILLVLKLNIKVLLFFSEFSISRPSGY